MIRWLLSLAIALALPGNDAASLAGMYDGGQTEVAAGLELKPDGRFRYMLSYGALDEQAEGNWVAQDGKVLLTSDPVTPPRFTLLQQKVGPVGELRVQLQTPEGISHQYFSVELETADGRSTQEQLSDEDLMLPVREIGGTLKARLVLPMFDLASDPVTVESTVGATLAFRFEPNDIGKVAFDHTPLVRDGGALVLERHDLQLRFRRSP